MPYTFTLTASIPASPEEIYQAWLDSLAHSEMTGGEASMSDQIGAEVSAWDGYISGRNIELIPSERIVQAWRTSEFEDEDEDLVITVILEPVGAETLLTLEHSNVPDEHKSYEEGGWESNYFEPMVAYFSERKGKFAEPAHSQPRKSSSSKASPRSTPKRKPESAGGTKRAVSAKKPKPAASRAKASPNKASSNKALPNKASSNKVSPKKSGAKSKTKTKSKTKGKTGAAAAHSHTKPRSSKQSGGKRK